MPSPWSPGAGPVQGRMKEVGFWVVLRAPIPSWAGSRGTEELTFHPGQEEEKKASFAPQALLNPSCIPLLTERKATR